MAALLEQPDRGSWLVARDYALLLFLYNTGARADEVARLTVASLRLSQPPSVRILGKGNKIRMCPLWAETSSLLASLVSGRATEDPVFLGCTNQPMTRFGIYRIVAHCAKLASKSVPSLITKHVSPHSIRHTTAVHLLRAGVDINTIRGWLGHVSLDTTNIYAEIDLEMKAKALAKCELTPASKSKKRWRELPDLMDFLRSL